MSIVAKRLDGSRRYLAWRWAWSRPHCTTDVDGDPVPLPKKGCRAPSPIFCPFLLWPNGWMPQDATCCGGRPQPRRFALDGDLAPSPKRGPPIFVPCLLWPNGCMDQDATWYGGRPWTRRHCVSLGHSSPPQKGEPPRQFSAHVYCGQTAGYIKMPFGMEVGLSLGDIMLDGDPAPLPKGAQPPNFRPMSVVAKRLDG